jgi:hypothetical protein
VWDSVGVRQRVSFSVVFDYVIKWVWTGIELHKEQNRRSQGVIKRCRLSLLTNSALVYESKCEGRGELRGLPSQPMSTAVHIT